MNSLKEGEGIPLLNLEGGPAVLLLNFRGVPCPTFKVSWVLGPGFWGPGPTFTPCRFPVEKHTRRTFFCVLDLFFTGRIHLSNSVKSKVISRCVKSVQIQSYFCSVFSCIWTRNNSAFGHFSRSGSFSKILLKWINLHTDSTRTLKHTLKKLHVLILFLTVLLLDSQNIFHGAALLCRLMNVCFYKLKHDSARKY